METLKIPSKGDNIENDGGVEGEDNEDGEEGGSGKKVLT